MPFGDIPAEGLIALGLVGDGYVACQMISGSPAIAFAAAAAALAGFAVLLYVFRCWPAAPAQPDAAPLCSR